jgi:molybdate transport system substrate-binding protein
VLASACEAEDTPTLRVFTAASLTEIAERLARDFDGARVSASVGASSALARQIRDGAPADVFLSASPEWMDFLREANLLAGEPLTFAINRLVCVTPRTGPLAGREVHDPASLLLALGPTGRVAIADEGVPAGEYARAALRHAGLLDAYRAHLVGQRDVRAVLHVVEQGELPAGFVYATDAGTANVEVLFALDPASHPAIAYQAVVLRDARAPDEARRFLRFVQSDAARAALHDAGFALP